MQILVLGAGQLARMMSLVGAPLNLNVISYDVSSEKIVHPLTKSVINLDFESLRIILPITVLLPIGSITFPGNLLDPILA